jgi:putative nucleotidyltransferase with HDIG domain
MRKLRRVGEWSLAVAGGLLVATTVTYHAGGTTTVFPHLYYLAIVVAAVAGGPVAGLVAGLVAGVLAGPLMPLDVDAGTTQATSGWLIRLAFFCTVGGLAGTLVFRLRRAARELTRLNEETVLAFVRAIDARDPYTARHSEKVAEYAVQLADTLRLDANMRSGVRWAGLLHDLGKIALPESVLNKPGSLDPDEWALIKRHPVESAEIVGGVGSYRAYIPAIRHHHERYDGRGYPDGISGDQIPLEARILAVADAFDAMTSTRQYRGALPEDDALAAILAGSGSQFDPTIARAFVEHRRSLRAGTASDRPSPLADDDSVRTDAIAGDDSAPLPVARRLAPRRPLPAIAGEPRSEGRRGAETRLADARLARR